jgi:hypothetical protein
LLLNCPIKKLISFLKDKGINESLLTAYANKQESSHGKLRLTELNNVTEGYPYISSKNKIEKAANLISGLDFLTENSLSKRLI